LKAILLALALLPSVPAERDTPEKQAQQSAIASAVLREARGDNELAAFLLAWGSAESNFALRIQLGHCRPLECDRGRARGPWQAHRNGMLEERWERMLGVENTAIQVEQAARHARWALHECKATGDERVLSAFRVLGGKRCSSPLPGEQDRLARFKKMRAAL
jgi:hypothetical protein